MWFMIPPEYNETLIATLPDNKKIIAKTLLGIKSLDRAENSARSG
jgi:hypothetical protein